MDASTLLQALATGSLPPDVVYVQLDTPIGTAVIDPGAGGVDSIAQGVLQALGIHVTFGFGKAPTVEGGDLADNLVTLGKVAAGAAVLWIGARALRGAA